ncbi:hypothetical protein TRVL_09633 [Trypanosoma vivax]|nr:hypothetical protein TRVL_09633 [Trypanosoma vivax]
MSGEEVTCELPLACKSATWGNAVAREAARMHTDSAASFQTKTLPHILLLVCSGKSVLRGAEDFIGLSKKHNWARSAKRESEPLEANVRRLIFLRCVRVYARQAARPIALPRSTAV